LDRRIRFLFLVLLGAIVLAQLSFLLSLLRIPTYAVLLLGGFVLYCYLLYRSVYKGVKPGYPLTPPKGRVDAYLPRTNIPRPFYEDMEKYPELFKVEKKRRKLKRSKKF